MEFEKDSPITEEQRTLAATKTATLRPVSADLVLEETTEPLTINERQPNLERDSEDTAARNTLLQPSNDATRSQPQLQSSRPHLLIIIVAVAVTLSLIGAVVLFISLT